VTFDLYGAFYAAFVVVGLAAGRFIAPRCGVPRGRFTIAAVLILLFTFVGSRLYPLLRLSTDPSLTQIAAALLSLSASTESTGAYLGLFLGSIIAFPFTGIPIGRGLDLITPFIGLAVVLGRLGCFSAGCCYGTATSSFVGVVYGEQTQAYRHQVRTGRILPDAPHTLPIHPTQLYEATCGLLLTILVIVLYKRHALSGRLFFLYGALYFPTRFVLEFYRGDSRGTIWSLSYPQWLAICATLVSIVVLISAQRLSPDTVTAPQAGRAAR
jgi:phosphatidylglycerol:prolipoprotein diacylglycerol transferase